MHLNPNAPAFVPGSSPKSASAMPSSAPTAQGHGSRHHRKSKQQRQQAAAPQSYGFYELPEQVEENIDEHDLEELEACDEWIRTMVSLEEQERECVIAYALSLAPEEALKYVEDRAGSSPPRSSHKHSRKPKAAGPARQ